MPRKTEAGGDDDKEMYLSCSDHDDSDDTAQEDSDPYAKDSDSDQPMRKKNRTENADSQTLGSNLQETCATTNWQVQDVNNETDGGEGDVKTDLLQSDTSGTTTLGQVDLVKELILCTKAFQNEYPELEEKCHADILQTIRKAMFFVAGGKYIHTSASLKDSFYKKFTEELLGRGFSELKHSLDTLFDVSILLDNLRPNFSEDTYEREVQKMQHRLDVISTRQAEFQMKLNDLRRTFDRNELKGRNSSADKILSLLESILLCNT